MLSSKIFCLYVQPLPLTPQVGVRAVIKTVLQGRVESSSSQNFVEGTLLVSDKGGVFTLRKLTFRKSSAGDLQGSAD